MASTSLTSAEAAVKFDAFSAAPLMRGLAEQRSRVLLWLAVPIVLAAVIITSIEGTLGELSDFQIWSDTQRTLGLGDPPASEAAFPLTRDYPSLFHVAVIVVTCALVHRQWKAMSNCLPGLRRNEVLIPRDTPRYGRVQRLLRVDRVIGEGPPGTDWLARLIGKVNTGTEYLGRLNTVVAFIAVFLAALVVLGENRTGIFEVIAPPGQSTDERQQWLEATYRSWWASTEQVGGVLLYGAIASLGIYVILLQNLVGFICVYVILSIPAVEDTAVDWTNVDGRWGWRPLAEAYNTVLWSVLLHGSALSVLLFVLGIESFQWVLILWVLWIVVLPFYIVAPQLVFRHVARRAKDDYLRKIEDTRQRAARARSQAKRMEYEEACRRMRKEVDEAVIRPLRLRTRQIAPLVIGIAFPTALAVGQLIFSFHFGTD